MVMTFGAALAAFMLVPMILSAQEPKLRSLAEYLQLPEDRKERAYPFIRCVGLFRGLYRYGGASFSDELTERTQQGNDAMMLVAFFLRQQKHPDLKDEDIAKQMGSEIESIELMYAERMKRNYSSTGEAYGSDEVITSDFEVCGDVVQYSFDAVQG